jgi:predicted esterase
MKLHFFIRGAATLFALVMITHTIAETMESSAESKIIQIELPELGQTLATRNRGEDKPVLVTAALPKDYCADQTYPLLVFLNGGDGGQGSDVKTPQKIAGGGAYICVNMPLFKNAIDQSESKGGIMISMKDYTILSSTFRAMLEALDRHIPNIRREGSVLGGFSNGAHATGVLLAHADECILSRFDHFYFIDGGFGPLAANCMQMKALASKRFLLLHGDALEKDGASRSFSDLAVVLEKSGRRSGRDVITLPMRGYGHQNPTEYLEIIGRWLAGEDIRSIELPFKQEPLKNE